MSDRSAPGPLTGTTVVVTRTRAQASSLVDRLTAEGATVVELPVIAIEDPPDGGEGLGVAANRAADGAYEWLVFTSANAASRFLAALDGRPVPRVHPMGRGRTGYGGDADGKGVIRPTWSRLSRWPRRWPTRSPTHRLGPEGELRGECCFRGPSRCVACWPSGCGPRGGWSTRSSPTRRWPARPIPVRWPPPARADAVAFASSSAVERTVELLGIHQVPPVVASIGPITSASVVGGRALGHGRSGGAHHRRSGFRPAQHEHRHRRAMNEHEHRSRHVATPTALTHLIHRYK